MDIGTRVEEELDHYQALLSLFHSGKLFPKGATEGHVEGGLLRTVSSPGVDRGATCLTRGAWP